VACCRRTKGGDPKDLYPDPDAAPLQAALGAFGARSTLVAWDDPDVDWDSFSHILISSTWDSVDRPAEYLSWARRVTALSTLVNPSAVIEWGLDKVHQRDLAAAGVPVIPTVWVGPDEDWSALPMGEFVVKPSVSAGGRETARYAPGDRGALDQVKALQERGQTVMVQEYVASIDDRGEVDLIFLDGTFSHAVAKMPVLRVGEGVVERPWERMAWAGLTSPSGGQRAVAERTMTIVAERVGSLPVDSRVDLVSGCAGEPLLLEVEVVDPNLSFDMEHSAAARLAKALLRR